MSCCPPSITPDYSGDSGGGGSSGVQTVTAGTNVSITGSGTNPIINAFPGAVVVSSIEGLSGAVNLIGNNISITTSGQDITLTATGSSSYPNITAGAGISVTGTAADPVITNLNPSPSYPAISAGAGITVGGTASAPVITNTNPTPVYPAISAGAGISVTGTAAAPIITNTASSGYPNITGGAGITVGGTAAAPIITNTNPTLISLSAGSGISINNSNPLAPIITNTASSGYPNITGGAGITVTGTAAAPVITNNNPTPVYPTISAGAGITVGGTAAAPTITNTNPTLISINPGVGIAVDNTNPLAPIISNNNATPFTLNSQAGAVTLQNNDGFISVNAASNFVNVDIPEIVPKLNNIYNKPVNIITNTLSIVDDIPAGTITIDGAGIIPVPLYTIYVSPLGNDTTGTGSVQQPYLTIQKAIDHRQANNPENVITEILIYSAVYSEDLTITMGNTIFSGYSSVQYDTPQVKINGSTPSSSFINIDLAIDEGIVLVGFVNITMNESNIEKTITATTSSLSGNYNLAFNNCNIIGSITATSGVFQQQSNLTITNSHIISGGTSPLITNNGCLLNIFQSQLDHSNAVTVPVILMEANASYQGVINCQYSKIVSSTNNTAPFPIIKYILSIQNTYIENINYNSIEYRSGSPDTGSNKCCIQYNFTAAIFLFVNSITGNTFLCAGVSFNQQCIQTIGSIGQVNIGYLGNNFAVFNANKISVNLTSIGSVLVPVTQ